MEISVGLYAVIFIFFFLIIPGYLWRRFYYHGEFSKQLSLHNNPLINMLSAMFMGIMLSLVFIGIHNVFFTNRIELDNILSDFDTKFVTQTKQVTESEKFNGLASSIYNVYLPFLGILYAFAAGSGILASKLVLFTGFDTKIKFLRFKNEWHYLFSGKILKFKRFQNKNPHGAIKVKYTYVDVLVSEKDHETTLYSGLYADYEINPNDFCKLEKIHLIKARRYKKVGDAMVSKEIPGSIFTILGNNILNINCTYIGYNAEEQKHKKFRIQKNTLITGQIITTVFFLTILTSFLFSFNLFNTNLFGHFLKQNFWVKFLIIALLNFSVGFLTPFQIDEKEKKIKFIGWGAILAKVILCGITLSILSRSYNSTIQ